MIFRLCRSVDCTERGGKQVTGCIQSFMLPWKPRKRHIWPVSQTLSSVYFLLAKFQLVSCNLSLALIWQTTYTHKQPKLCSATLNGSAKTSTRDSVKIYLVDQRGPATVWNLFWAMLSFLDNYVTHTFSHFRAALTWISLLSAWSPI